MEHRSTLHGSTWCTGCCCTPAAAWAAVLHRAFGDLFPVSGTSHLGLTLHSGPSLRHLQFNTHGSVLTHRLMASKTKKITTRRAVSPFPTVGCPSWSYEEMQDCCSLFLQPWLPSCFCHRWLEMAGYRNWDANSSSYRTIISVCYQLQMAHWFFLCYLILSIPGPDPIKIPSSICITETHPNLNKSLFAGLTSPACCKGLCLFQVGSVDLFSPQLSYDISIGIFSSQFPSQNTLCQYNALST